MSTAVTASMPEQIARYEEEVKIWAESKAESRTDSSSSQSDKDKVCHVPLTNKRLSYM